MDLDDLIEYESENTCLDFKAEEYGCDKISLIKDIMSMANANSMNKKYIIIGVKDIPGSDRQIIGLNTISDQANLENVIQENIEPNINFKYYSYFYKEKRLGIIEIDGNTNPPYMMKKDHGALKKGDIWIRKGSRQSRVVREDIDRMFLLRNNTLDSQKIQLGFGGSLDSEKVVTIPVIDRDKVPSNIQKQILQSKLDRLKKYESGEVVEENNLYTVYPEYHQNKKEIKIGTNYLGMPVYYDEKTLKRKIKDVTENFEKEDYYFFFEENSIKLNFSILNNTNAFLEDVKIQFKFDKRAFTVAKSLPKKPRYEAPLLRAPSPTDLLDGYPYVEEENNHYLIIEEFENIRHKELITIFTEEIRCILKSDYPERQTKIEYVLSSKNLPDPIKGKLTLKWN